MISLGHLDVGCSYYLAAMNNERKPLLSDDVLSGIEIMDNAAWLVRERYERLITEGKLRVVEHASPVHKLSGLLCSICSISWQDDQYCRGCGNKIKR
jgi:hypothetical protein